MELPEADHRRAPEDFLVLLEAFNPIQSQDAVKLLSPVDPFYNFKEKGP